MIRYKILGLALICLSFTATLWAQDNSVDAMKKFANTITKTELRLHLDTLASPHFEGRGTGQVGQRLAAAYIVEQHKKNGIMGPLKGQESQYIQHYDFAMRRSRGNFKIVPSDTSKVLHQDYQIHLMRHKPKYANTKFAFAGWLTSSVLPKAIRGKYAVLYLENEVDHFKNGGQVETSPKKYEKVIAKLKELRKAGAKGVVLVGRDAKHVKSNKRYIDIALKDYSKLNWTVPVMLTDRASAMDLLNIKAEKLNKVIQKFASGKAVNYYANAAIKKEKLLRKMQGDNVLAFIEGTDKKDEVVVISAHYDHLGIYEGVIYPGADDDGSGTVALLEIAQAFSIAAKNGSRPRRSILFLSVSGEELGLHGSSHYADKDPVFDLDKTVVDLNIDMVGRKDDAHESFDYVYVIGSDMLSTDLHNVSEEVAKKHYPSFKLDYKYNSKDDPNQFYYRSDHYNFAKHNIPVIFYFSGVHDDYHMPTDTPDKINYEKLETVARLVFSTAWEVANREKRLVVDKAEPKEDGDK